MRVFFQFISKHPLCWQNLTASVSRSTLNNILSLTCLDTPEIEIVKAVDEWVTLKCDEMGIEKNIDNKRRLVGNEVCAIPLINSFFLIMVFSLQI